MKPERIFRSTRTARGVVLYNYPPQAITLSPCRKSVACIIAMSVEPREIGKATHSYLFSTLNSFLSKDSARERMVKGGMPTCQPENASHFVRHRAVMPTRDFRPLR